MPAPAPALRQAGTPRGQLLGVALIVVPAITNALPLTGAGHTALQVVAVVIGTLGMVVVFGGLFQRTVLNRPALVAEGDDAVAADLDAALLAVPHAREVWAALALLTLVLLVGAVWCLALTHWIDALVLVLPGLVLAWACWRGRGMRAVVAAD